MILHHKTQNSSIIVEHSEHSTAIHVREWRDGQQIKDAGIELDRDQLEAFKEMLEIN